MNRPLESSPTTPPAPPAPGRHPAAAGENFPVASRLIAPALRPAARAFYAYARAGDDIADDPALPAAEKLAALGALEAGLTGPGAPEAEALAAALAAIGREAALAPARDLLGAFRQDARGAHYEDWADLRAYCAMSADPVGRFLLALHGEGPDPRPPSDALCTALQVLNHLQDLRADRDRLGRVYLPARMLAAAGAAPEDLSRPALTPAARRAVDSALDRCDALLSRAAPLPRLIASPRLGGEARAILHLARRLSARLRRGDPLARRIKPSRADFAAAAALGLAHALRRPPSARR